MLKPMSRRTKTILFACLAAAALLTVGVGGWLLFFPPAPDLSDYPWELEMSTYDVYDGGDLRGEVSCVTADAGVFVYTNDTSKSFETLDTDIFFDLEIKLRGRWYTIKLPPPQGNSLLIGPHVGEPGEVYTDEIQWPRYGSLPPGLYRLVRRFDMGSKPGVDVRYVAVEFEIADRPHG